jgi:Transposase and inactivated derivatives
MKRDAREIKYLEKMIKKEKDPQVRDRLRGILLLKKNYTPSEVAKIFGVTERTVYNWKTSYTKNGYEGLKSKPIPGRNTFLDDDDMKKLKALLEQRDYWTTKEVRALIKNEFDREFTLRHIPRILRKLGMKYQKPYVHDYRRPEDAEEMLKKNLRVRLWTIP